MPILKAWVERPCGLIERGGRAQALKVRFADLLNESRYCFLTVNICSQSKLLQDIICFFVLLFTNKLDFKY